LILSSNKSRAKGSSSTAIQRIFIKAKPPVLINNRFLCLKCNI